MTVTATSTLDRAAVLRLLDAERKSLARDGEALEILPHVTRCAIGGDIRHLVLFSSFDSTLADEVITDQVEHYRRLGAAFEWKAYGHDPPADLTNRLAEHGLDIGPREAVMVLDLAMPPAWVAASSFPVGTVTTSAQLELFRAAAEGIFGKDYALTAGELARGLAAGSTDHLGYIACEGGEAVSIGRLYTHAQSAFGGLYGGGTRPSHRGRGWYRAVVAARARDAISFGARYLIVDALPTSRPILERLGFIHLTDTWPCDWRPGAPNGRSNR